MPESSDISHRGGRASLAPAEPMASGSAVDAAADESLVVTGGPREERRELPLAYPVAGIAFSARGRLTQDFATDEEMLAFFSRRSVAANIPRDVRPAMYRITEEALQNGAKHAGELPVNLLEALGDTHVRLIVRDSGEAFDVTQRASPSSLGLIRMQEQATLTDAGIHMGSELGEGTTVTAVAPVSQNNQEASE